MNATVAVPDATLVDDTVLADAVILEDQDPNKKIRIKVLIIACVLFGMIGLAVAIVQTMKLRDPNDSKTYTEGLLKNGNISSLGMLLEVVSFNDINRSIILWEDATSDHIEKFYSVNKN